VGLTHTMLSRCTLLIVKAYSISAPRAQATATENNISAQATATEIVTY